MQLYIYVIMKSIFFQCRCLRWISSWEWMLYLTVQITSLQTYHYEQVGTFTVWWCYCPADSSCFLLSSSFQSLFLFTNLSHNRLQSCLLDFFITSFCMFLPLIKLSAVRQIRFFFVAFTETESFSSFPDETRIETKELWVTRFYKLLCWGFFLNLNLQRVACFYCHFADCKIFFFSFWMMFHLL